MGGKRLKTTLLYILAILILLVMVYPYAYMIISSLAPWDQVDKGFIPNKLTLRSYEWMFLGSDEVATKPWLRAFFNSIIVTTASTVLMVVTGALAAYALAKVPFRGKGILNNVILFQMFFPAIIMLIPTFLIVKNLGLYDTYWGMILPKTVSLWAIFLYVNFFRALPDEVIEAAKMDGATTLQVIWKIVVPMSKGITTIIFLFLFMERWVELLWDMLVVKDESLLTINVLLAQMFGPYAAYPGPMYAASVVLTLPIIILFIIFRKNFTQGIQFVFK
ncbi:carbohydrate ABC transporter permease [Neobacillus sp. MM2021_6]|uniref:carbohydrate ABC transporter permease n=1 Tax=Bacillaceae TaxID=186817 RepID=UPI00140E8C57|nr:MULTISPECIES: carbohydrate ABC transporter permease [Bacillaceae]MBO0959905.1 carbohydrate ABC transporter permease [Neobacillus sp. MM2021_6]NHC18853.1 carbohydrate ABC transporter permease [Bacillus sp. MM2020_4]